MQDEHMIPRLSDDGETIVEAVADPTGMDPGPNFKLFVAAISATGSLDSNDQNAANGSFGTAWTTINPGPFLPVIATGTTLDGRIAIVTAEKASGSIIYTAENLAGATSGRWDTPENLGLPSGVTTVGSLALARGVDGLDNVFMSSTDNTPTSIWWKYRNPPEIVTKTISVTPPGSTTPIKVTVQESQPPATPWSDWININGNLQGYLKQMKAANNADGRIVLSGIYFNGIPWVSQQKSDDPYQKETWTDWVVPGGTAGDAAGDLTPVLDQEGRVSMFASTNYGLLRSRQDTPGSATWDVWSSPGQIPDNVAHHAVCMDADDNLYAAALNYAPPGQQTLLYGALEQNAIKAQWTSWQQIGMVMAADQIALNANADGRLTLFVFDTKSTKLQVISQVAPGSTEWMYFWTEIGSGISAFSVAQDLTP